MARLDACDRKRTPEAARPASCDVGKSLELQEQLRASAIARRRAEEERAETCFPSASDDEVGGLAARDCASSSKRIVQLFTKLLEWRCLDRIRALIQELCVAYLPD